MTFQMNGREYDAIEQNPERPSRWGQLARELLGIWALRENLDLVETHFVNAGHSRLRLVLGVAYTFRHR